MGINTSNMKITASFLNNIVHPMQCIEHTRFILIFFQDFDIPVTNHIYSCTASFLKRNVSEIVHSRKRN